MKAADLLVRCLEHEGVRYIFGTTSETANSRTVCPCR